MVVLNDIFDFNPVTLPTELDWLEAAESADFLRLNFFLILIFYVEDGPRLRQCRILYSTTVKMKTTWKEVSVYLVLKQGRTD